jgi:hypothetical protein
MLERKCEIGQRNFASDAKSGGFLLPKWLHRQEGTDAGSPTALRPVFIYDLTQ